MWISMLSHPRIELLRMWCLKELQAMVTLGILFLVQPIPATFADLCPSQEDLHPCACVSDGKNIRIDCISVTSTDDLKQAMLGLRGYPDVAVDFSRCRLPEVPLDLFSGLSITRLSFTECDINEKSEMSFSGLENSLQELSVTFSFPESNGLTLLNASYLHSLEHLEVEGNYVKRLQKHWFGSAPKYLRNVFFMTNDIEHLDSDVFSSLINVKNLWITGNKFTNIRRSMFPRPANHLMSLDFGDNRITDLPTNLFSEMPSLKEVIFTKNKIKILSEDTWRSVWRQITRLYLEDNPLHCDEEFEWMFRLSRPFVIKGRCVSPPNREGTDIKTLIDSNRDELIKRVIE